MSSERRAFRRGIASTLFTILPVHCDKIFRSESSRLFEAHSFNYETTSKQAMLRIRASVLLLLFILILASPAGKKWRGRVNWDAIEAQLETGDDAEELRTEDSVAIADMARRRAAPFVGEHASAQSGPTMLFAFLRTGAAEEAGGAPALAETWTEQLHFGGIGVSVYDVAPDRLLVALQRGWRGEETKDFLLAQPEVVSVEWDGREYEATS